MIPYLRNAASLKEYYNRIEELYPVLFYEKIRRNFFKSEKYWDKHLKYTDNPLKSTDSSHILQTMANYYIYSWPFSTHILTQNIGQKVETVEQKEALSDSLERDILKFAYIYGIIDKKEKQKLQALSGKRNEIAHSGNLFLEFSDEKLSNYISTYEEHNSIIQTILKKTYGATSKEIYEVLSDDREEIEDIEEHPTFSLHKIYKEVKEEENYFPEEAYSKIIEYLNYASSSDILTELKNRGYEKEEIESLRVLYMPNKNIMSEKNSASGKVEAYIQSISPYIPFIPSIGKTELTLNVAVSDITEKNGERDDKALHIDYGCMLKNDVLFMESKDIKEVDLPKTIKCQLYIGDFEANTYLLPIEFFLTVNYNDIVITDKMILPFLNIEKISQAVADVTQLYGLINTDEEEVDYTDYKAIWEKLIHLNKLLYSMNIIYREKAPDPYEVLWNKNIEQLNSTEIEYIAETLDRKCEKLFQILIIDD